MRRGEKRMSGADWLVIVAFGLAAFFHLRGFGPAETKAQVEVLAEEDLSLSSSPVIGSERKEKLLLFILDFRDFSCMLCLESFLELHRRLSLRMRKGNVWGVLTFPEDEEKAASMVRIAEKKLRGFVRSHQIHFPVLVDRYHVFGRMAKSGSGLILIDEIGQEISRFDFPLDSGQMQKIMEVFGE